jgi:hypothetical protein
VVSDVRAPAGTRILTTALASTPASAERKSGRREDLPLDGSGAAGPERLAADNGPLGAAVSLRPKP